MQNIEGDTEVANNNPLIRKDQHSMEKTMIHNLTDAQWDALLNAWRKQNDTGNGEPFVLEGEDDCREADSVAEAIDHETVTLLAERGSGIAQQAIVSCGEAGCVQMVCNANGAWLCDVTETWRQIAA
ncbi:MAG TPA: hypothetical protein PLD20_24445 [Blastocatellia bacterium]|nr:hypothetical protein [Blastocatellia bacterium]HMY73434.1 hypothetical protein [Blastocatellia bacterium]HMZ21106.1 hypothetical protein [Blastocatellia bacterium]HNG34078.1 hypothetical protein [Blastocatellia bacterium]